MDDLMTVQQIADYAGVKPDTITGYRSRGQMPPPTIRFGRTPLWSKRVIVAWRASIRETAKRGPNSKKPAPNQ